MGAGCESGAPRRAVEPPKTIRCLNPYVGDAGRPMTACPASEVRIMHVVSENESDESQITIDGPVEAFDAKLEHALNALAMAKEAPGATAVAAQRRDARNTVLRALEIIDGFPVPEVAVENLREAEKRLAEGHVGERTYKLIMWARNVVSPYGTDPSGEQ